MENITDWFFNHKGKVIILFFLFLITLSGTIYVVYGKEETITSDNTTEISNIEEKVVEEKEDKSKKEEQNTWRVDIKGSIKKPGVYQVNPNTRIHEVIDLAGGFTKNATSKNINLSKKVTDEMVIYIYSTEELEKLTNCPVENKYDGEITKEIQENNSIIESNFEKTNSSNKIVSLNSATKEELMLLEGIGSSKADSIISYRQKNNGFKTIEELKNISGIGEVLYEQIKNYLTL